MFFVFGVSDDEHKLTFNQEKKAHDPNDGDDDPRDNEGNSPRKGKDLP